MTSFSTEYFDFYTYDPNNPKHIEAKESLENDPIVNNYLKSIDLNLNMNISDYIFDNTYLVAVNDTIVGYLAMFDYGKIEELHYAVIDKYRGLRIAKDETIGEAIVKDASEALFDRYKGLKYIRLFIESSNIRSAKVASKVGFKLCERYKDANEYRKYKTR